MQVNLSYQVATCDYFERIRPLGQAILLDSGKPASERGRYDILSAAPVASLSYYRGALSGDNLPFAIEVDTDPFAALEQLHQHGQQRGAIELPGELPFCGGLLGYFGYDLGRCTEQLPSHASDDLRLPEMAVGLYSWAIVIDHTVKTATLVGSELIDPVDFDALVLRVSQPASGSESLPFSLQSDFASNMSEHQYHQSLARIDNYIRSGDCYQVNFAQRFKASCSGDPWQAYKHLREHAPTHYAAYIDTDHGAILSLSPERFLTVDAQGEVLTQPIKGTQPRQQDPELDQQRRDYLANSRKDRAENLMIVDLLRNDLSKICALHSVKVPKLFDIESYRNVHHLVSSITGQLAAGSSAIELLKHCFPGGSITGAPKIRSMEIIDELEPQRRSIYCGSIGYVSLCGRMDTSITIRTLLVEDEQVYCWAGGGIVADSDSSMEYQETFDKVNNLLKNLETFKV